MTTSDKFSFHNGLCFTIGEEIDEEGKLNYKLFFCKDNSKEFKLENESLYKEKLAINFARGDYGRGSLTFADKDAEDLFLKECGKYEIGFEMIRSINARVKNSPLNVIKLLTF